jgi:5-methylcytosine-specific restriction endonuclease McrA
MAMTKEEKAEYDRKRYLANREKYINQALKWRSENPDKHRENQRLIEKKKRDAMSLEEKRKLAKKYRATRGDRMRASSRKSYQNHKARASAYLRQWKKKFIDKVKSYAHARRAKLNGSSGRFTAKEWKELCERYGNKCLRCGQAKPLTPDHIVPVSKGGSNSIENIQPLCQPCNSVKHTQTIDYRN